MLLTKFCTFLNRSEGHFCMYTRGFACKGGDQNLQSVWFFSHRGLTGKLPCTRERIRKLTLRLNIIARNKKIYV